MIDEIFRLVRPVSDNDHVLGPQSSPATLVEYGDYECPHCRQLHPMILELMKRTEGLRFVYRHFPIVTYHPHAARAAEAAEAAGAQGRFWEMHNLLFEQTNHLTITASPVVPAKRGSTWRGIQERWTKAFTPTG
jgi:protein-disulfide isomerase